MSKSDKLAEIEGYANVLDLCEAYITDSVAPGICTNKDCDYTTEVEPDQGGGYCEECETQTVASIFILEGII